MERLTYRGENGKCYVFSGYHGSNSTERKRAVVADRLAAYEDTGLEPEQIVSLANGTLKDATVDIGSDLYRLAIERVFEKTYGTSIEHVCALLAAENDGRVVVLPCKRGDKVWRICGPKGRKFVAERQVLSVTMYSPGSFSVFTNCSDWLGKTVFLTRAEAEAALKGANDG